MANMKYLQIMQSNRTKLNLWIKRLTVIAVLSFLLFFGLTNYIFKGQFLELNVLINKYADLNINQNTGLHKFILVAIKKFTLFLPSTGNTIIQRDIKEIGVGNFEPSTFYKNNVIRYKIFAETNDEILSALSNAKPGTQIIVKPGIYTFAGRGIPIIASGEPFSPIVLKALRVGSVIFKLGTSEGLMLNRPFWRIENLIFKGNKDTDSWIDHAIHITGNADYASIVNNEFINFNSHIKANGILNDHGKRIFPDHVLIQHNNFYNEWKRNTTHPVNFIDVVGGEHWLIENNFIADFGKNGRRGRGVAFGAYLKGASKYGIFQKNLVACKWKLPYTHMLDIRVGLSFGGGSTGQQFCMDGKCSYEHDEGIMRQNTIVNCKNDVSIYLNKSRNTKIYSNILLNSLGIDVRYPESSALIYSNELDGRIKARDGAFIKQYDNDWVN